MGHQEYRENGLSTRLIHKDYSYILCREPARPGAAPYGFQVFSGCVFLFYESRKSPGIIDFPLYGGWPILRCSLRAGVFSCTFSFCGLQVEPTPVSFCGLQVEPTPGRAQTFILAGCKYSPHPFLFSN
jgi:hypothetical protein